VVGVLVILLHVPVTIPEPAASPVVPAVAGELPGIVAFGWAAAGFPAVEVPRLRHVVADRYRLDDAFLSLRAFEHLGAPLVVALVVGRVLALELVERHVLLGHFGVVIVIERIVIVVIPIIPCVDLPALRKLPYVYEVCVRSLGRVVVRLVGRRYDKLRR